MPNGEHVMKIWTEKVHFEAIKEIIRTKWNRSNGRWLVRRLKNTIFGYIKPKQFPLRWILIAAPPHINKKKETINFDKKEIAKFPF